MFKVDKKYIQCNLCEGYIYHSNLLRHKRTKKCIRKQVSNHLDRFWLYNGFDKLIST